MVAFNFFLLPPIHTFSVADPQNWVVLFVFVVVAAVASQLSTAARQREALRQQVGLATVLLASISHDLRTPVTAIRVAVANLLDDSISPAERRTQARITSEQLDRLTRLLDDLLSMARIDASAVNPERQWVTPADIACGRCIDARAVAVATGDYSVADLRACGPHAVFDDLSDTDGVLHAILH
jgi:K+-sensing histidine kinase KdpD